MPKIVDKYRFFQLLIEQFGEGAVIDRPALLKWYDSDIAHDPMMPHHVTFSGDRQFRADRGMYRVPDRSFLASMSAPKSEKPPMRESTPIRPNPEAKPARVAPMSAATLMSMLQDIPDDPNRKIDVETLDTPDDLIQYLPMSKRLKLRERFFK